MLYPEWYLMVVGDGCGLFVGIWVVIPGVVARYVPVCKDFSRVSKIHEQRILYLILYLLPSKIFAPFAYGQVPKICEFKQHEH